MHAIFRKLPQPEAMLFDLDGTLFRTETLLLPAYHAAFEQLRKEGLYEGETPAEELMLSSLGMLLEHIWERVLPAASRDTRHRIDELLLQKQKERLQQGAGSLYDGVTETLRELRERGVRLFVASNGLEAYVKSVVQATGIAPFFEGLYSAGEYGTRSKVDLVQLLLSQNRIESAWMIGDRSSDVEAGRRNRLTVVGCDYAGFRSSGELDGDDLRIRAFPQLLEGLE